MNLAANGAGRGAVWIVAAALWASGCGRPEPTAAPPGASQPATRPSAKPSNSTARPPQGTSTSGKPSATGSGAAATNPRSTPPAETPPPRSLGDLLDEADKQAPPQPRTRVIDPKKLAGLGIRTLESERLTLYTDLPSLPAIDELPRVFDQALPAWRKYFGLPDTAQAEGRMSCYLIGDRERFREAGLLTPDLPPFLNGYAVGRELWVYEQPSDYYRRHLLLHEGTHAFMFAQFGTQGPPWYLEGVAELLATHRWADGKLTLGVFPHSAEEADQWGRVKIVREAFQARQALRLAQVLAFDARAHLRNEPYGWSWAAAALLDGNPNYRERFRALPPVLKEVAFPTQFHDRFAEQFRRDEHRLDTEWELFVAGMEYGYDFARTAIEFRAGEPLPAGGGEARVAADRGWQASGWRLEAGVRYRLQARGRYQVALRDKPWLSEAGGVTIRYYQGRPLGQLLAALVANPDAAGPNPFLEPEAVGLEREFTPRASGTLYFKINDSAAELADNAGECLVRIERLP